MTKWFDLLDLSKQKKLLDMLYIDPRGVREGIALIFFWKSVFEKHPTEHGTQVLDNMLPASKRTEMLDLEQLIEEKVEPDGEEAFHHHPFWNKGNIIC